MNSFKQFLILSLLLFTTSKAQIDSAAYGEIEIFVIDSYITPEQPYKLILSFFTSDSCTAKIQLSGEHEFVVSSKLNDNHKIEITLDEQLLGTTIIKYFIYAKNKEGFESRSQLYEVEIPGIILIDKDKDLGLIQVCCFGGIIFGLPSPTLVIMNGKNFFGISKEVPIFSFYSGGYNYPFGYIGAEYSYLFNSDKKNFLRIGYKQIFQIRPIEFLSLGINFFSDLKGYNGISPEFSVGLFKIQNVFTLYSRYRYNFQPNRSGTDFHEFSIGLYSNFFSINL
jgi:hypothetical protein